MGYTTDFTGYFTLDKALTKAQAKYINLFCETRRMKRNENIAIFLPDPVRVAADLPIGEEAEYFVGGAGFAGQEKDNSITNYNDPPARQPGLWCHWVAPEDDDGNHTRVEWDGSEKFYYYVEWLTYMIERFYKPWGYTLNGQVEWVGENSDDIGRIIIKNNEVSTQEGKITYTYESEAEPELEIEKNLVLSTGHVTKEDMERIESNPPGLIVYNTEHWSMVYLSRDDAPSLSGFSDAFKKLYHFALNHTEEFTFLKLESDGRLLDGFESFDW